MQLHPMMLEQSFNRPSLVRANQTSLQNLQTEAAQYYNLPHDSETSPPELSAHQMHVTISQPNLDDLEHQQVRGYNLKDESF